MVYPSGISGPDALIYADAARRAGIRVLWDVSGLTPASDRSVLDKLDAHPATFGFYLAEEPDSRGPVQAVASLLGQRHNPRIGTLYAYQPSDVAGRLQPLVGLCEIITCASYPVGVQLSDDGGPDMPLSTVGDIAKAMSSAAARQKFTAGMTLQAFSWGQDATLALSPDFARWPTRTEMRTMRNAALGGGVQLLFWFTRRAGSLPARATRPRAGPTCVPPRRNSSTLRGGYETVPVKVSERLMAGSFWCRTTSCPVLH